MPEMGMLLGFLPRANCGRNSGKYASSRQGVCSSFNQKRVVKTSFFQLSDSWFLFQTFDNETSINDGVCGNLFTNIMRFY